MTRPPYPVSPGEEGYHTKHARHIVQDPFSESPPSERSESPEPDYADEKAQASADESISPNWFLRQWSKIPDYGSATLSRIVLILRMSQIVSSFCAGLACAAAIGNISLATENVHSAPFALTALAGVVSTFYN